MKRIRVLVVDDSLTVRKHLVDVIAADPELEVVGEASDGKLAIELCERLRPDVITLDMMLPVMTGLSATEYIMAYCPTPILIVSASTNRGELLRTYDALAAGAVDVLDKPLGGETDDAWERTFRSTVKLVSRIKVITHLRARTRSLERAPTRSRHSASRDLIAIGASTGGPGAIMEILSGLSPDFPIPILIVLHIGESFGRAFADWLDGNAPVRVALAVDGEPLPSLGKCRVIVAPPERHLIVDGGKLRLTLDPERHSCRPSVDVLFESLAREMSHRCAACLLTGMGRDGASGLLEVRRAGGATIAQDEASSVVYGMPREAALLGAAERILALGDIAAALSDLAEAPPIGASR